MQHPKCEVRMDITIRPARAEDVPQMCGLLVELFTLESDFEPDFVKQVKGLGMLVADPSGKSFVVVAVMDKNIIGMGTVQLLVSTAEGGAAGLVEDIIVQKNYRGTGIGSRILSRLIEWSKMKGATRLQLLADRDNADALDFYRGRGWSITNLICLRKHL